MEFIEHIHSILLYYTLENGCRNERERANPLSRRSSRRSWFRIRSLDTLTTTRDGPTLIKIPNQPLRFLPKGT